VLLNRLDFLGAAVVRGEDQRAMTEAPVEMRLAHASHVDKTFSAGLTIKRQFRVRHYASFPGVLSADCVPNRIVGFAEQIDEGP
jgi:hypothetical protein